YIEETEELAMKGLMANRHILDLVSNELLEKSMITGWSEGGESGGWEEEVWWCDGGGRG
ncbi:hypothetical protein Tco_1529076, partial [Tanacetum coccineum]